MYGQCFLHNYLIFKTLKILTYTVKKVIVFPVPSRDVTDQTLPGGEYFNPSQPGRLWLVTSQLGTGKTINFFYSVAFVECGGETFLVVVLRVAGLLVLGLALVLVHGLALLVADSLALLLVPLLALVLLYEQINSSL